MQELLDCGHPESPHSDITRGYGTDEQGKRHCYACCAAADRKYMQKTGRIMLYLVKRDDGYHITNWPSSLDYKVTRVSHGRHNIGRTRTDAWFRDELGNSWHAVQIGDFSDLARCQRLKH
jgi:hypothetical protein